MLASKENLISWTKFDCFSWLHFQDNNFLQILKAMKGHTKKATEYLLEHVYYFLSVKVCIEKKKTLFKKPKETHDYPASLQQITEHLQMVLTAQGRLLGISRVVTGAHLTS